MDFHKFVKRIFKYLETGLQKLAKQTKTYKTNFLTNLQNEFSEN